MGSKGIRRRKRRQPLPKVGELAPFEPPPVMWPAKGSGFSADPFSPAGTAERYWAVLSRRRDAGPVRVSRTAVAILLTLIAVILIVSYLVTQVL